MAKVYTAVDPLRLGNTVVVWVYVQVGAQLLQVLANAYNLTAPSALSQSAVVWAAMIFLVTYAVDGFLGLKWIYRVNRNAHAFAKDLPISPPWSVGWFFVPIASLVKPYEAMANAWRASERPRAWKTAPRPKYLAWWWAAWLAWIVGGGIANGLARFSDPAVAEATIIFVALLAIPADLLFIRVVRGLSRLQQTQINFGLFDEEDEPLSAALLRGAVATEGA